MEQLKLSELNAGLIAEFAPQRSTVGKKIWFPLHLRSFGSDKVARPSVRPSVRTYVYPSC